MIERISKKVLATGLVFSVVLNIVTVAELALLLGGYPGQREVKGFAAVELLSEPWHFKARKELIFRDQQINPSDFRDKVSMRITYNLHGLCVLPKYGSGIIFNRGIKETETMVSFFDYGKNCFEGDQVVEISLADFQGYSADKGINRISASFWYSTFYDVEIKSIQLLSAESSSKSLVLASKTERAPTKTPMPTREVGRKPTNTISLSPTTVAATTFIKPTVTTIPNIPTTTPTVPTTTPIPAMKAWNILSVSSMKETKDKICGQDNQDFIDRWINKAVELGVNYIAIEQPYDSPACGDTLAYTQKWVASIRAKGLSVWHRHMPLAFEGIYDTQKRTDVDYIKMISDYIKANPTLFKEGDIFTPIPEPQNGGISGVSYCSFGVCIFKSAADFNLWLRNAMTASENAFATIGLAGKVKVGYFGFDGFIAWGDNNPDWNGILEDQTIAMMGNITIDHYPEIVGDTMENDLNELQARYPGVPVVIGEWGTITGGDVVRQVNTSMVAAKRTGVTGFNYWHMGMGGNEALIQSDFANNIHFPTVQSYFQNSL